jgi:hypothetical protein
MPFRTAPLPAPLLFSLCPSVARTERFLRCFFTTIAQSPLPLHRPLMQPMRITAIPSPFFLSHGEVSHTGALFRPSSGEPPPRPYPRSTVDQCRPWSTSCGPSPRLFLLGNKSRNPTTLQKGLYSYQILTRSPQISKKPLRFFKIIPYIPLATFQKLQISPRNSFTISLQLQLRFWQFLCQNSQNISLFHFMHS